MTEANRAAPKSAPQPKTGLMDIAPYVGGKSVIADVARPIKLSSNENALGAGARARQAFADAASSIHLYPDGRADRLRAVVAEAHDLEPERLVFGNGSDEVFALLNQTYLEAGDNMVTSQYAFVAYQISARACQAEVRQAAEPDLRADVDAMLALVDDRTKLVYLSNPANPTGSIAASEEIRRLHAGLPPHVILVIDEAYAEFVVDAEWESAFALARNAPNVVVTRTFSKLHGLGGLRVGYGYAPLAVEQAIDRIRLPFNVSLPGIAAAIAAQGDEAHQKASRDLVAEWRPRLTRALRGLGLQVMPSAGNFILIRFPDGAPSALSAHDHLQSKGIIVRSVASYGLADSLRITVGTADQNRAVIDALSEFAAR